MSKIFDDLNRLEEMQNKLSEKFERVAQYRADHAGQIASGYAAVTQAIHELKEGDTYFTEIVRQLESEGTKEARLEAMRMRRERNCLRSRCDLSDGRHRTFE